MPELEKIEMPIVKVEKLEINSYDYLASARRNEVDKFNKLEKTTDNYKAIKEGKNSLVKKRTEIVKLVKSDCKILDDVKNLIKLKGQELIDITEPLEKDLAGYVDKIDNEAKKLAEQEEARKEALRAELSDYRQKCLAIIGKLKLSDEAWCIAEPSEDAKKEFPEIYETLTAEIQAIHDTKVADLKEREEFAVKQAELKAQEKKLLSEEKKLENERAEIEKLKAQEQERLAKLAETTKVPETPAIEDDDDLPELVMPESQPREEPEGEELTETEEADLKKDIDELDALLDDIPEVITIKDIYNHLYKKYPILHSDRYFQELTKHFEVEL